MPPLIDQLLLPQRLAQRGLFDLARIADAAVALGALAFDLRGRVDPLAARLDHAVDTLDTLRDEVAGLHRVLHPMSDDLDGLRQAFEGSNKQLAALRQAMTPELRGGRGARAAARRAVASARVDRRARRGPEGDGRGAGRAHRPPAAGAGAAAGR